MIGPKQPSLELLPGFQVYTRRIVSADRILGVVKVVVASEAVNQCPDAHRLIAEELSKGASKFSKEVVQWQPPRE